MNKQPETRANPRLRALNAQEGSREQREKNGGMHAENDDFRRGVLKRPRPETAPTLAFRAKKIPTDKGWDFKYWWWNTEPNPRPHPEQDSKVLILRAWILTFVHFGLSLRTLMPARPLRSSMVWPSCTQHNRTNQQWCIRQQHPTKRPLWPRGASPCQWCQP